MKKKNALHSEAAECLRMALPLMSKHGVPVTPRNYAIWYEYVSGSNDVLKGRIEELIRNPGALQEGQLEQLYEECIATFELKLAAHAREVLRKLLAGARDTFSGASSELTHFDDVLATLSTRLTDDSSREEVRAVVCELSAETKLVQEQGARLLLRLAESQREVEELRAELEQARKEAKTDALTGLANRGVFDQQLRSMIDEHTGDRDSFGLVLLDIDRFKAINDTHGHLVGDKVIRFVANTILATVKGQDIPVRYGGEEFAVLLPHTDLAGCVTVAEGIRRAVERSRLVKSSSREALGVVTVSSGIAVHRPGEPPEALVGRADAALYLSKTHGRNCTSDETAVDETHLSRTG